MTAVCGVCRLRDVELEPEVLDELVASLVPALMGNSEASRQSVVRTLTDLQVDPKVILAGILRTLDNLASSKVDSE